MLLRGKEAERGGEPFVWGPTYRGWSPDLLAQLGGEDRDEWMREREEKQVEEYMEGKRCGCDWNDICERCAPPIVLRRWEAGCACRGSEVCIDCVDPKVLDDECA